MDAALKEVYDKLIDVLGRLGRFEDVGYQEGRQAVAEARELVMDALTMLADAMDGRGESRE